MDNELENEQPREQTYVPRPAWQVWGARVALVVFILTLLFYYLNFFRGGA